MLFEDDEFEDKVDSSMRMGKIVVMARMVTPQHTSAILELVQWVTIWVGISFGRRTARFERYLREESLEEGAGNMLDGQNTAYCSCVVVPHPKQKSKSCSFVGLQIPQNSNQLWSDSSDQAKER